MQLDALDPGKFDFNPGWLARACGWIPFIGSPVKRYFTQYESAQVVIAQIIRSLEEGREVLKRDNHSIKGDQEEMRRLTIRLGEAVQMGKLIDAKLSEALKHMEDDPMADEDRHRYLEEELLFPLRQRLMDIEQQLLVNQQGVIAIEVVIRNNKELIKGVDRAINVTVNALSVAVTVALALANQKIVLNKIKLVNDTTNNLIAYTAKELRTVGTEIHKQASTLSLDLGTLKQAFTDFNAAMQDISNFRREALPNMAKAILEMDDLASKSEQTIQRMELGNQAAPQMLLDI